MRKTNFPARYHINFVACASRKSNPNILVMQSIQDRTAENAPSALTGRGAGASLFNDKCVSALRILRPLAERGDAAAQYELGDLYYSGLGVPQVEAEAVEWYRRAALQGHPAAQHMLALSYEYGTGVARNMAESLKWLRRAAQQGYGASQNRLGQMYQSPGSFGVTFEQDLIEAHKWYNLSAAGGEPGSERERTELETHMTPAQIDEAQRRAGAWKPKQLGR
jgi:TPR repeat protein